VVLQERTTKNLEALRIGKSNVVGGTSWLWSPEALSRSGRAVLDEAGRFAGGVLAVSQAGKKLVLLGVRNNWNGRRKEAIRMGAEKSALNTS